MYQKINNILAPNVGQLLWIFITNLAFAVKLKTVIRYILLALIVELLEVKILELTTY